MTNAQTFTLDRQFSAPQALVWRTLTEPALLERWYGPNVETVTHAMDLRPGGEWRLEMKMGRGSSFQKAVYVTITPIDGLVWLHSGTDADWNITASPMMPDWPHTLRTEFQLSEAGGITTLRLIWTPHDATEAELASFAGAVAGLGKGWGMGMTMLEALLTDLQA